MYLNRNIASTATTIILNVLFARFPINKRSRMFPIEMTFFTTDKY